MGVWKPRPNRWPQALMGIMGRMRGTGGEHRGHGLTPTRRDRGTIRIESGDDEIEVVLTGAVVEFTQGEMHVPADEIGRIPKSILNGL